jgi:hypothetical protein
LLSPDGVQTWVSRRDRAIVGSQSGIPFKLKEDERVRSASWAVDLIVDPEWRLRGIGPALSAAHFAATDLACGLGVSDAAYRGYIRAGWVDLGVIPHHIRPLDARWSVDAIGLQGWRRLVARMAAPPMVAATGLVAYTASVLAGVRLEPIEQFDERADEAWRRSAPHYSVLAVRDRAALAWRFDVAFEARSIRRYYLVREDSVYGYVITRVRNMRGRLTLEIVDYLAPPRWLLPLLALVARLPEAQPAVAITCHTLNPAGSRAFAAAGYVRLGSGGRAASFLPAGAPPIRLMIHRGTGPDRPAFHRDRWFVTAGDSDVALWDLGGEDVVGSPPDQA